jgi:hypothetical protein
MISKLLKHKFKNLQVRCVQRAYEYKVSAISTDFIKEYNKGLN